MADKKISQLPQGSIINDNDEMVMVQANNTKRFNASLLKTFIGSIAKGNLTESTSSVLTIGNGTNAVIGSGTTIQVKQASSLQDGFISSSDYSSFSSKEPALTKGSLTESTSGVLTITGGTSAVIGSGTTIQVKQASASQSGYLSSTNWSTFNNKQDTIQGGATSIVSSDLTASRALTSDAGGKVAVSATTSAELGYVSGVTSAIQTQLNAKQGSLTLTTTGTSGAATLVGSTLNIPQYSGGGGSSTAVDQVSGWAALGGSAKGTNLANIQLRCTAANGFGTGILTLQAIYVPTATTITGGFWIQATNGSYVANNYNGVGLYSYSGGTATLVASSTNDANVFQSGVGIRKKAFSSTYSASAGVYYVALLASWSSSTTAPNFWCDTASTDTYWQAMDFTNSSRYIGRLSGQTSLPSSVAFSSVSQVNYSVSALLY
jgi:hypothetical protein